MDWKPDLVVLFIARCFLIKKRKHIITERYWPSRWQITTQNYNSPNKSIKALDDTPILPHENSSLNSYKWVLKKRTKQKRLCLSLLTNRIFSPLKKLRNSLERFLSGHSYRKIIIIGNFFRGNVHPRSNQPSITTTGTHWSSLLTLAAGSLV